MPEHAEVGTKFTGDDSQLKSVIEGVKKAVEGIKSQIEGMAHTGEMVLGFLAVEHEIKHALAHESELARFKATLDANGFAADEWSEKLEHTAAGLQEVTGTSKQTLIQAMQMGLNMGVAANKLQDMTKQAVAMSGITHMSVSQSMRMLTQAQEGHFSFFNRYIPKLKEATSNEERMVLVNEFLRKGWKEAAADTPEQQWNLMTSQMASLRREIGEALLPTVMQFVAWARVTIEAVKDWAKEHHEIIKQTVLWTSALAFGLTVLPKIYGWIAPLGKAVMWLVTSPLGAIVIALGVVGSAVALLIGSGDTWVERWRSGFGLILDFLDTMLGSWQGFKSSLEYLWTSMITGLAVYWLQFTTTVGRAWSEMFAYLKKLWLEWSASGATEGIAGAIIGIERSTGAITQKEYEQQIKFLHEDMEIKRANLDNEKKRVDAEAVAEQAKLKTDFDEAMAAIGVKQIAADKEFEDKKKNLPKLSGRVQSYVDDLEKKFKDLQKQMKSKLGDMGGPPKDLELGEGVGEKGKPHFEDASAMYKRIAAAAAGQDPLKIAKDHLAAAQQMARDLADIKKPWTELADAAVDKNKGLVVQGIDKIKTGFA